MLEKCGRAHSVEEVHLAIEAVRASGIRSWSLDLISGLPELDMAGWRHSLDEAIRAGPDHVSVYDLQVWTHVWTGEGLRRQLGQRFGVKGGNVGV